MLTFGILGGSFFDLAMMPAWFRWISKITPNAWGLDGFTTLALGGGLADILSIIAGVAGDGRGAVRCLGVASSTAATLPSADGGSHEKNLAIIWKDPDRALLKPGGMAVLSDSADRFHLGAGAAAPALQPITASAWRWWTRPDSPLSADLIAELEKSQSVRPDVMALQRRPKTSSPSGRFPACWSSRPASTWRNCRKAAASLELRQQPNNLNALVAYRAVQAVISRVSSAVEIANASVAEAEQHPALCLQPRSDRPTLTQRAGAGPEIDGCCAGAR